MLTREYLTDRNIEEDEKIRKDFISKEISSYTLDDYRRLFAICSFLEKTVYKRNQWYLDTGLDCVFEALEDNSGFYINVITEYFNENAPFRLNGYRQIKYLIDHIGYEATLTLLSDKVFDKKYMWLSLIWECLPEESINEKIVDDYRKFVLDNFAEGRSLVPTIQVANRYGERDRELKDKIIEAVVDNPNLSATFLGYVFHEDNVEMILNFFRDDLDALVSIYINAIENSNHMDYGGKLFIKIFGQQPAIWNKYVDWAKDNIHRDGYEQKIFDLIWTVEKWRECVDYAFKILIDDNRRFSIEEPARLLFAKLQDGDLLERKKLWLFEKLHERSTDVEKCKNLIDVVVTVLPDWKLEYILEFLKENKNPEDFKKLHLFPLSYSWSGSEVPLILKQIDFLQSLKDRLRGIDYIEHRKYLEERRRSLERYKEEVELREYIENADYA